MSVNFRRSDVDNYALKQCKTRSYPSNNCCTLFRLCITLNSDPSLYCPGSPIIHSIRSFLAY
ncbi:hypothetical protein ERD95_06220 [Enterobacteriaceae bacterium ML5]|nr:hypothetical protein ERD95_06220 [Enterobacteriaceae bacterium ML5]